MKNKIDESKVTINKLSDEVSVIKYTYGVGIFNKLNVAIDAVTTDYVLIVNDAISVSEDLISKMEIKDYYVDTHPEVIELKYLDKVSGIESTPHTTSGFYRMDELFPASTKSETKDPYVSKLTIYKTNTVKYVLDSLGDRFPELMTDIDFVIQTLIFRLKEKIEVAARTDRVYGIYVGSNTEVKHPLVLMKSYRYITKLLKSIGLRRDYYSNYVKYTHDMLKKMKSNEVI